MVNKIEKRQSPLFNSPYLAFYLRCCKLKTGVLFFKIVLNFYYGCPENASYKIKEKQAPSSHIFGAGRFDIMQKMRKSGFAPYGLQKLRIL